MQIKPTQEQKRLDITKIKTVEELNSIDFSKYADKRSQSWVRYIVSPVTSKALNEICDLSEKEGATVKLGWTMGELYYNNRSLPQIKPLKQMPLPGQ